MKTFQLCNENTCCGCGACATICSQSAISMVENQYGFIYPEINENICIDCGACKKVCTFSKEKTSHDLKCYAGANKNENQIMKSASGGIFSAIAYEFLKADGYVCGAVSNFKDGVITVEHEIINTVDELPKLQGSKYVQSTTLPAFKQIQQLLKDGQMVLFSGTPCQVDAIKSLCKKYVGTLLFTIDIICHGVPSQKLLNGYLSEYQKIKASQLTYIDFRNKKYGWGKTGIAEFSNGTTDLITPETSSYYNYFMGSEVSRENCYSCPYANLKRVGDLTIGDYWGAAEFSPEIVNHNILPEKKGISCLIVNNIIGEKILNNFGENLMLYDIDVEKLLIYNTQLREPTHHTSKREEIFATFANQGYGPIEKEFQKKLFFCRYKKRIKKLFPQPFKDLIKQIINRTI